MAMTALVHLLWKTYDRWESAGGRSFDSDGTESAESKARHYGEDWVGDDPHRRYEITLVRR
jgi:hypothetical protein